MHTTILNWLLGINFFTYVFRNELPLDLPTSVFLIPTISLLTLELIHFSRNLVLDKPKVGTFYRNLDSGDIWRMYSALAIANWVSVSSTYALSALLFIVVTALVGITFYIICLNLLRKKKETSAVPIVGLLCLYLLCGWLKTLYISQYGVSELGHWLEKPKYTTFVQANVTRCTQKYTCSGDGEPAEAYIEVINESYEDEYYNGDGYRTTTVDYREIWVFSFKTNAGEVHDIQSGYLENENSGWVEDSLGRRWLLYIKNYK